MYQIQLKSNALWCAILLFGVFFSATEQTNSSVILSTITSRVSPSSSSSSGNSSLSATSTFNGYLYSTSRTFTRPYGSSGSSYYYQAIQVTVSMYGAYSLTTSSSMDTYGCLYDTIFDPTNPNNNLIAYDDDSGSSRQFLINYNLFSGHTYILVVTTFTPSTTGGYTLSATGSFSVSLSEVTTVTTTKSGYISSNNPTFARPDGSGSNYRYESIEVRGSISGSYVFRSSSASSTDLYGCLYLGSFNPSYPTSNKLICDDDHGGDLQFQFSQTLYSYNTYILVVTTSSSYSSGSYSVIVTGPASVSLAITTPTTTPDFVLPLYAIISIAVGGAVCLFVIVAGICVRQRRQRVIIPVCTVYGVYPKL